jgi:hypothetical protein
MWVLVALLRLSPRAEQMMQRGDWMLSEKTAFRFKMGDGHKIHARLCSRHQIDFGSAPASSVCVPLAHRCARLRLALPCASGRPPLQNIPQLLCSAPLITAFSVACSNFLWLCSVCCLGWTLGRTFRQVYCCCTTVVPPTREPPGSSEPRTPSGTTAVVVLLLLLGPYFQSHVMDSRDRRGGWC